MPIFQTTCIKCHGGSDGTKGDLSLKTFDDMMKGGQDGAVIKPGDANGSLLVKQLQNGKMPKRGQKLPQDQIDLIAKWVTEGAKNN
jgi:mono/diheme cytochrome c family protein